MKYKLALLLILFCVSLLSAQTQPEFPASAAGKRAALFLQMLNSKDDAALKEFITGSMIANPQMTLDQRIERFRGIRESLSGAKLTKVLSASDENMEFVIETAKGEAKKVSMGFTEDAEKRIAGFGTQPVDAAPPSPAEAPKPLTETEFLVTLGSYLEKQTQDDKFSGVVLVAKNGAPIFSRAYGLADRDKKVPNNTETKFNIGSENKIFTQLAIGILADEGKLSLSDTIGKYLPDYPNKEAAEKVTIEQLLVMRSGIGDFFGPEFQAADKSKIRSIKDYLPFFTTKPLLFPPGTKSRYSNGGYLVLGVIIEKISGKSYYDFVRERIFKPAGMSETDSYEMDAKIPNRAKGYMRDDVSGKLVDNSPEQPGRGSSAGGGYSTAGDMLKFAAALESGKLPSPRSMENSPEPIVRMISSGIRIAGGSPGINAAFSMKLKGSYTVVVLSNLDPPSAEEVSKQVRTWLGAN